MKNGLKLGVVVGLAVLVVGGLAVLNSPVGVQAQDGCSAATVSGAYIYGYDGYQVTNGQNVPFAYTGREVYNGDGTMSGVFSGEDSTGVISFGEYEGVYTVNEDCTGTLTTDPGTELELNFDIFIDESTGDFYFTGVDEGSITQGFNQKVQN